MNDQTKPTPTTDVVVYPSDAMQMMTLCRQLADARLLPTHFQKSPADVFLAMAMCRKLGFDFFMAAPSMMVIKGKVSFDGKLTAGIVNTSGRLAGNLNYEYHDAGNDRWVRVIGKLVNEAEPRTIELHLNDARTENDNWKRMPDQMLAYAGARVWARRHVPELLLGLEFGDDAEMIDITPHVTTARAEPNLPPEQPDHPKPEPKPSTQPFALPLPDDVTDAKTGEVTKGWRGWGATLIAYIRACTMETELQVWVDLNNDAMTMMRDEAPQTHKMLGEAIAEHRNKMVPK